MERMKVLMLAICMLVGIASLAYGANDAEPGSINWDDVTSYAYDFYVNSSTNKPAQSVVKCLFATTNLIATHVQTDASNRIDHCHSQYNFGNGDLPTVAEANVYWDHRFASGTKTTILVSATNTYNCHTYGFQQSADGGTYNYWTDSPSQAYTDDFVKRTNNSDVQATDLLRYPGDTHTTVVTSVASQKPTGLKWKFNSGGVYSYSPQSATAFNTPMCSGFVDTSKEIDEQPWTWTESYVSNPDVYRDD